MLRLATAIAALMALHVCAPASMPQVGPGSAGLQSGTIVTVAGNGEFFVRDGGPATGAEIASPSGVAVDTAGNLYIADSSSHRVRRVDPAGVITTVAGTDVRGYGGDGGAAANAQLHFPSGVAVDGLGNLYIADRSNHRVRKVDRAGVITTVAGTGELGYGGDGGPAAGAELASPSGVAVDGSGNLYIADESNHRVRRVDPAGVITTVAGTAALGYGGDGGPAASAELAFPLGVAVDGSGNLYIADSWNDRVRKVDRAGVITTVAGTGERGYGGDGGPAASAQLYSPRGVAVDGSGNLYIADSSNDRVRRVDLAGVITTVAGTGALGYGGDSGPAVNARLGDPSAVAVDASGNLYIADGWNHRVRKVDRAGVITTVAGTGERGYGGDGGPAASAQLTFPRGVAVDGSGNLYIADSWNHRVRRVDLAGVITTVAGTGERGYGGD
ncbi:MAG: NHL repeat-containing protein, partial [Bryobacterales bacterium]|nr:NHL repeat-containing protein [Bryobacterales bacterium]